MTKLNPYHLYGVDIIVTYVPAIPTQHDKNVNSVNWEQVWDQYDKDNPAQHANVTYMSYNLIFVCISNLHQHICTLDNGSLLWPLVKWSDFLINLSLNHQLKISYSCTFFPSSHKAVKNIFHVPKFNSSIAKFLNPYPLSNEGPTHVTKRTADTAIAAVDLAISFRIIMLQNCPRECIKVGGQEGSQVQLLTSVCFLDCESWPCSRSTDCHPQSPQ